MDWNISKRVEDKDTCTSGGGEEVDHLSVLNELRKLLEQLVLIRQQRGILSRESCIPLYLTVEVQNAFNSVPWGGTLAKLSKRKIAPYNNNIVASYIEERRLIIGDSERMLITCGVPQGSVLAPTLLNLYYDVILKISLSGEEN